MASLDKADIALLDQLQLDGRVPNARLADKLAMSEASSWRRQKRLEEAGVIQGYQAVLDRRQVGLGVTAFVQIACTQHGEEVTAEFERLITVCDQVLSCHSMTGEADFLLQVVARDLDDYSRFVEQVLRQLPGVASVQSNLSLREIKSTNRLPLMHGGDVGAG